MSDIFGNLDNFLDNYDENNLSVNSTVFDTGSGRIANDDSRRLSPISARQTNNVTGKKQSGKRKSRGNRNNSATTITVIPPTTSLVSASTTPVPPSTTPSIVDLTPTTVLSVAEEMQLLCCLFDSMFNSKNPFVTEQLKDREAVQIKRSFNTLNNSYNRKPPVTANELMKVKKKLDAVRIKLTQLEQKLKNALDPVSVNQPIPGARRTRSSIQANQVCQPIVISLDCDDDPVPNAQFSNRPVTRRSRTNASNGSGSEQNVISLESDDDSVPEFVGQFNNSSGANNSFETENYVMRIKVQWKTGIEMFEHRRFQKFADMFAQLAAKESADSSCIFLNLDDRIVYPNDTPESIDYKPNQFISGRILSSKAPGLPAALAPSTNSSNAITLKIQMESRKQPLRLQIEKQQTMAVLVIKCAEELKCEPKDIKLYFDGELIDNSSKPEDLDLEGEEILDIRFVK